MSVTLELDTPVLTAEHVDTDTNVNVELVSRQELDVYIEPREYKVVGDDVYIPINFDDAPLWLTDAVTRLTDVKVTDVVTDLNSMIDELNYAVNQVEIAKNQYEQSITSLNDIDSRFNSLLTTINSNMGGLDASLKDLIATKVTSTQASVVALEAITTSMNDTSTGSTLGSALINLETSITNLNTSVNTSLTSLESSINGAVDANAQAVEVINTYVGIDDAGASTGTGLSAYLEDSTGNIGGADSSVANNVYVDGLGNTRSKFEYNSNLSYNGYNYQSGFGIATNLTSSTIPIGQSEFWINASKFKFTNTNKTGQVAPFTIDASGVTPQITFNGKVTFSNVTNTTGTGSNLLYNSAPKIGSETKGWYVWTDSGMTVHLSAGWDVWKPTGGASVVANIVGNPSIGSVYDVGQSLKFPVIAGSRYEASAYISAHRSTSCVYLVFYDSSGTYIGESRGNVINYAGSNALVNWGRSSVFTTAPNNAATALLIIRSTVTGTNPYCFAANAFAGVAEANQTTPSNWSEGTSAGATYTSELSNDAGFTTLGAVASQGYVLPAGVANAINANTTTVDGSKITTGSIAAAQINVTDLFSKNITYTGVITGGNVAGGGIIQSYNKKMKIDLVNGSIYIQ